MYLNFVIKLDSSGEATEHHSSKRLKIPKGSKSMSSKTLILSSNSEDLYLAISPSA